LVGHAHVSVKFDQVTGATPAQAAKLERARVLAEQALNDTTFRTRAILFSSEPYGGRPGDGYLQAARLVDGRTQTVGSNTEVVSALLAGNGTDGAVHIRVDVTTARPRSRKDFAGTTLGMPDAVTDLFPGWLDDPTVTDAVVAENLIHEHLHRLGFEHEFNFSEARCGSAPYAIGKLVCAVSAGDEACIPHLPVRC
jgi:hypothetical protein